MKILPAFILACVFPTFVWAACSKPLSVAVEDWPPYSQLNTLGKPSGLDIELMEAIFKEAGCTLVFREDIPRQRRHLMHKEGQLDVLFAASPTPERRRFSWFTIAYRSETIGLFARSEEATRFASIRSFDNLLSGRISLLAPNSGWYGDDYARYLPDLKASGQLQHFETFDQGIRMLKARRADLILGDVGAVFYEARYIAKLPVTQLTFVPNQAPVHLMLSKASVPEADLRTIDAAIRRLETNGTLTKLRGKYGLN
ncbi:substrate-binding periplasmic protein [Chitiniphilus eburneus]|uniref:Amino acid ABC transporter substrate-binding protein n=1 Tax=Chitiniphilus eburneus TaxID=2571148 RepID=A0A4U0PH07_9NEIS|nr:transporter substrate-binding domain-containing protein [Chitiniphilus eburneus]TJZ67135.1 amino acid ABC transporter substrate-binding protein [Chitiniphilus eburneus]